MLWLRFAHYLVFSAWFGGALAAMIVRVSARREGDEFAAPVARLLARLHGRLIAPAAILTVITGFLIIGVLVTAGAGEALGRPGVIVMQTAGLIAAMIVLVVSLPAANRLARLYSMDNPTAYAKAIKDLRRRQAVASMSAGLLFIIAMAGVVLIR